MFLSKSRAHRKSAIRTRRAEARPEGLFENLEQRLALYQVPMATGFLALTNLEDRNNSIVRILTNVGRIDIELFEALVPAVTANFRNYINSGATDEQFFHALGAGVLQAGRYKFNDGVGPGTGLITTTPTAPISNGFSRSNLQRTLAMVPINSLQADSQFIINLQDNPALNAQSGGFTVFGKVIQGWDIVTTIAGYAVQNLNQQLTGNPTGPFTAVPVRPAYNPGNGPTEATLVKIIDIETIKAPGQAGYYSNTYVYPEGFRSATTTERIDVVNEDIVNSNYFQIIIHYETGERDQVLYSGQLSPGQRFSFKVNDQFVPGLNIVRSGVGYAFDVRSTRKMGVTLDHRDNGVSLAESFYMTPVIPSPQFTRYNFPQASKSTTDNAYLMVEELDGKNVTINVLIYPFSGGAIYVPITIEAFRRGGINLNQVAGVPNGDFSMYVTCLTPFAASVSQYRTGTGLTDGSTSQGVQGLGRVEGALAGAMVATGGEAKVDVFYPGSAPIVIVDFVIRLTNGTTLIPSPVTLTQSNRRGSIDLTTVPNLPRDQFFSITYSERQGVNAVSASYRSKLAGDVVSTPFQIVSNATPTFADGYTDPTLIGGNGMSETISIYNPYANGGVPFFYQFVFHFSDGAQIFAPTNVAPLNPLQRADHRAANFPDVLAKINSNTAFRFYSIQVISVAFAPNIIGGVVTQLTRIHNTWGQSLTSIPSLDPSRPVVYFDHPEFNP